MSPKPCAAAPETAGSTYTQDVNTAAAARSEGETAAKRQYPPATAKGVKATPAGRTGRAVTPAAIAICSAGNGAAATAEADEIAATRAADSNLQRLARREGEVAANLGA